MFYWVAANPLFCPQPELYKNELVRQPSTDSTEFEFCGKLHFSLKYDLDIEALVVKVSLNSELKNCKKNNESRVHDLL